MGVEGEALTGGWNGDGLTQNHIPGSQLESDDGQAIKISSHWKLNISTANT